MLLDNRKLYRLAAPRQVSFMKRSRGIPLLSSVVDPDLKAAELFARKNHGKAFPLANSLGRMDGRQDGKFTDGL